MPIKVFVGSEGLFTINAAAALGESLKMGVNHMVLLAFVAKVFKAGQKLAARLPSVRKE